MVLLVAMCSCGKREGNQADGDTVVFRDSTGRVLTLSDLSHSEGSLSWEVTGGEGIPRQAQQLHEQARRAGEKGDFTNAIATLNEASQLAPRWPYPVYDLAFTYLLMGRDSEALDNYEKVDRMDPKGFFTTKTALWALRAEKAGHYPRGTYLSYLEIEWAKDEAMKSSMAKAILDRCPSYAPAWKELALRTEEAKLKQEAFEHGLASSPDGETFGILTINKALFLNSQGQQEPAMKMLGELALSPDATRASAALAKSTMANLIKAKPPIAK